MRSKENAQDYRYFPDPDMLTYVIPQEHIDAVKASIPELPVAKTLRYMNDFSLSRADAELLARDRYLAEFFDDTLACGKVTPKGVANWLLGDISKVLNERHCGIQNLMLKPEGLAKMVELIESKKISNSAGKTILDIIIDEDRDPEDIVKEKGLAQVSDTGALQAIVDKVIAANEKAVNDVKAGKMNAVGFLVGQCMKESRGQGNPGLLREMLKGEDPAMKGKTIFVAVAEEQVEAAKDAILSVTGDLSLPNAGVLFGVPVTFALGIN